jgi:hypothetical protein
MTRNIFPKYAQLVEVIFLDWKTTNCGSRNPHLASHLIAITNEPVALDM